MEWLRYPFISKILLLYFKSEVLFTIMKNIIIKLFFILLLIEGVFALHGKIVFYDGTYVVGKVTKVDEATVYIVPIGLDTSGTEAICTQRVERCQNHSRTSLQSETCSRCTQPDNSECFSCFTNGTQRWTIHQKSLSQKQFKKKHNSLSSFKMLKPPYVNAT